MRKEQQKLQNLVKQLRLKIRALKMGKISRKSPKTMDATIQTEPHDTKEMKTQTEPMRI